MSKLEEGPKFEPQIGENQEIVPEKKTELTPEELELKKEGERVFQDEFAGRLEEILGHKFESEDGKKTIILQKVVDEYIKKFSADGFSDLPEEKKNRTQRKFVSALIKKIKEIPADDWSKNFKKAMETGKMDCSTCMALIGLVLENTKGVTGIKGVECVHPPDHAANIVAFSDGGFSYADARNGIFEDLALGKNTRVEEKEGVKVYKRDSLKGEINYKIFTALPFKEGVLNSYLSNMECAYDSDKGEFLEDFRKINSSEELKTIKEKLPQWKQVKKFFGGRVNDYLGGEEFQNETKRWERSLDFKKGLEPLKEKGVSEELVLKQNEIISFLLFKAGELSLDDKEAEALLKSFRNNKAKFREENGVEYDEQIQQIAGELKRMTSEKESKNKNAENKESREHFENQIKKELAKAFDEDKGGKEAVSKLLSSLEIFLQSEFLDDGKIKQIRQSLEECKTIEDKNEFIEKIFLAVTPIVDLKFEKPEAWEKIERIRFAEAENSYLLNEILCYDIGKDNWVHIHLAPSKYIKNKRTLLKDGFKKLAKAVEGDEKIKGVIGTSWIIANNPGLMEKLGFTIIGEIGKEEGRDWYFDEDRPVGEAFIGRNDLIKKYLKESGEEVKEEKE